VLISVVIPVKGRRAKSRLSGLLTEAEREELSLLLLRDVLGVLTEAGLISSTCVVSSGRAQLEIASSMGATVLQEERDRGVNEAVRLAISRLRGSSCFIVLPSDLPLLKTEELAGALELRRSGLDVVISPSASFDGTNLLLFCRKRRVELSYDRDSFWNHLRAASRRELSVAVTTKEGLMRDLDTVDDARVISQSRINRASVLFLKKRIG
jgi:2-phospho-L-lactate guanylyltransferase